VEQSKEYNFRRVLIESINGGMDAFETVGKLKKIVYPDLSTGIEDQRSFDGWKHYES